MLNPHLDRSPVGRASGWLVVLTCVALTMTLAGLSLTAAGAPPADRVAQATSVSPSQAAAPVPTPAPSPVPATAVPTSATPAPAPAAVAPRSSPSLGPQVGPTVDVGITVLDQFERLVPNAVVTLSSEAPPLNAEGRTGRDGRFTASGLLLGSYQISVSKPGFKTARTTYPARGRQAAGRADRAGAGIAPGNGSRQRRSGQPGLHRPGRSRGPAGRRPARRRPVRQHAGRRLRDAAAEAGRREADLSRVGCRGRRVGHGRHPRTRARRRNGGRRAARTGVRRRLRRRRDARRSGCGSSLRRASTACRSRWT